MKEPGLLIEKEMLSSQVFQSDCRAGRWRGVGGGRKGEGDVWAEKDSYVLKQATASESVKSSSLYFEFMLTSL